MWPLRENLVPAEHPQVVITVWRGWGNIPENLFLCWTLSSPPRRDLTFSAQRRRGRGRLRCQAILPAPGQERWRVCDEGNRGSEKERACPAHPVGRGGLG